MLRRDLPLSFHSLLMSTLHYIQDRQRQFVEMVKKIGWIGQLHPKIQKRLGISTEAYLFQVDFSKIEDVRIPSFQEVSKFPEVKRDLAFLVDASVPAQRLVDSARKAAGKHLIDLKLFDVYQSKDVDSKGKSIALGYVSG